jgi:type II secretory pathway predicted ATPase ExeA
LHEIEKCQGVAQLFQTNNTGIKNKIGVGNMYTNFFGFSEKPFELTPDPKFLYLTPGLREVLATLIYGVQQRRGFIVILGEPGTGKTTLLNAALDQLEKKTEVALILNTGLSFNDLLHMILVDLELADIEESLTKKIAVHRLNQYALKQSEVGGNVVIIIDEAQHLNRNSLENLRLLSNLESHKHKLIQIILAGQPELETTLDKPELRQLAQRIGLRRRTAPLNQKDAYEYIQHRLDVAGYRGAVLFGNRAKKLIWTYSKGIPRTINMICDNAFLYAYSQGHKRIDSATVREAIQDIGARSFIESEESATPSPGRIDDARRPPERIYGNWFARAAVLLISVCLVFALLLFYRTHQDQLPDSKSAVTDKASTSTKGQQGSLIRLKVKAQPKQSDGSDMRKSDALAPESHSYEAPQKSLKQNKEYPKTIEQSDDTRGNLSHPKRGIDVRSENQTAKKRFILVKSGETLVEIIRREYGKYNESLLNAMLRENPEIQNPDLIYEKQIIKLPKNLK